MTFSYYHLLIGVRCLGNSGCRQLLIELLVCGCFQARHLRRRWSGERSHAASGPPRGSCRAACRGCSLRNLLGVIFSRRFSTVQVRGGVDGVRPRVCASDWSADALLISYWSAAMSRMDPPRCGSPSLSGLQRAAGLSHLSSEDRTAACGAPFPSRKADPTWRLFAGADGPSLCCSLCFQAKWVSRSTLRLAAAPRPRRPPPCRGSAPTSTRRR